MMIQGMFLNQGVLGSQGVFFKARGLFGLFLAVILLMDKILHYPL